MTNIYYHCKGWVEHVVSASFYHSMRSRARGALCMLRPTRLPLHRNEEYAPFFIVGSGRAGTTLLRRILQEGEQVHIPPEIWSFQSVFRCFLQYRWALRWEDIVPLLIDLYIGRSDFGESFKERRYELIRSIVDVRDNDRSLATFIDKVNRYHGEHRGATFKRWGDKTPLNSFCLQEIIEVFPDARFVHLVRDGADVVYSYVRHGLQPSLEEGASRWNKAVCAVQKFQNIHPDKVIEIRYENLVRRPRLVVQGICDFLNIKFEGRMVEGTKNESEIDEIVGRRHHENVFKPISDDHVGKGRRRLGTGDLKKLDNLIGEEIERLGYDPLI